MTQSAGTTGRDVIADPAFDAPGVGLASNAQSAAALSVSTPFGSRSREPSLTFESSTGVGEPSTRLTGCGKPSIWALVIEPSYERASTSVCVAVSISATPSGAPFWIWLSAPGNGIEIAPGAGTTSGSITTRYWSGARQFGPSATRVYSVPVRPLTRTTALSARSTGTPVPLKTSTNSRLSAPTLS